MRARALVSTALALAALALLGSALAASAPPAARPAATGAQSAQGPASTITPIPIPEIAQRAEQATTLLRSAQAPEASEFRDAELELTEGRRLDRQALREHDRDAGVITLGERARQPVRADAWQAMRSRLVALNDKLTRRATLAQQRAEQIETMRATWAAMSASADVKRSAPPTVLEQIDATMAVIAGARRNADDGLARVLALQDRTVKEIARCDDVLARIAKTENALVGSSRGARHAADLGPRRPAR